MRYLRVVGFLRPNESIIPGVEFEGFGMTTLPLDQHIGAHRTTIEDLLATMESTMERLRSSHLSFKELEETMSEDEVKVFFETQL